MKLLFDFFPIVLFFLTFKFKGIYAATAVAIAASMLQILWLLVRRRKIEPMVWISLAVLAVFGGSTILLHNELFIKWKPTILYGLFALIILIARGAFGKNIIKAMLQAQIPAPDPVWERLNLSWAGFFIAVGALNLFVAYHFPTAVWVNFKLFGILGCILVFSFAQGLFLLPYAKKTD